LTTLKIAELAPFPPPPFGSEPLASGPCEPIDADSLPVFRDLPVRFDRAFVFQPMQGWIE